ncbi:MAG TPA: CsbD family protein [Bryobacteraceae bacterium]|nr:CsbD family protein [Bryobacteraceae bacterium]
MNSSTKDRLQGKFHEVKGKIKQKAGQAAGNPDAESKGQAENIGGKVQKKIGQIENVFEK